MWQQFLSLRNERAASRAFLLGLALSGFAPLRTAADPAQEGRIVAIDSPPVVIAQDGARSWVSASISFEDSAFIRIHFTGIRLEGNGAGTVRVLGSNSDVLAKWTFREFATRGERWTHLLPEGYAIVQAVREDDQPVRLQFTIKEAARESHGGTVQSRQDPLRIRDRDIAAYAGNPAIMGVAKSVAKLSFPDGDKLATCTGFMVTPDLLLTNHHCVSTIDTCFGTVAVFGYQRDESGHVTPTKQYDCLAVLKTSKKRDYSLLRIDGSPGAAGAWGALQFNSSAKLAHGQALYVVQHPGGEPKRVALDECKVSTLKASGALKTLQSDFGHRCDTESGSSGSPVFDLSNRVVGLHHLGFDGKVRRWSSENRAVYIGLVLSEIDGFLR